MPQPSASSARQDGHLQSYDNDDDSDSSGESSPSPESSRLARDSDAGNGQPMLLKRRRVTRAVKKIKCDAKHPCTHCTVYGYSCTYDQPSHRRRNAMPQYLEALEARLARTEALLHFYLPNLDINDSYLDPVVQKHLNENVASDLRTRDPFRIERPMTNDSKLESMVNATGQLDLTSAGSWDYAGHSSGLNFIRRIRNDLQGPEQAHHDDDYYRRPPIKGHGLSVASGQVFGSGKARANLVQTPYATDSVHLIALPSKPLALGLCSAALDDACAIISIVHQPTFYAHLDRIYALDEESFEEADRKFLPLLYIVCGIGLLFAREVDSELARNGYRSATDLGYPYFWASRQLLDVTDAQDLTSLQAIVYMVIFLQCSARLATCYAFIGVALRSAIRQGLHRSFRDSFNPIESECRKRTFWAIRNLDIYVGAMLGLPQTMSDDDIDQDLPTEVADEFVTTKDLITMSTDAETPPVAASIASAKLHKILSKIVRLIYPTKGFTTSETPNTAYAVSYKVIKELENDLQKWTDELPQQLRPSQRDEPVAVVRKQQLLRVGFAYAQLMLYRPFLHYVSTREQQKPVNQRSYACAACCVSVSRNIIHITGEMNRRGLLQGNYWYVCYSSFFAILSLVFLVMENPESTKFEEAMVDARHGKETLSSMAEKSMAADRCMSTLNMVFDHVEASLAAHKSAAVSKVRELELARQPSVKKSKANPSKPKGKRPAPFKPSTRTASVPDTSSHASSPKTTPVLSTTANKSTQYTSASPDDYPGYTRSTQATPQQHLPYMPTQDNQYQSYPPDFFANMSAAMYPSHDPFQYPHPPMTLHDQNNAFGVPGGMGQVGAPSDAVFASTANPNTVSADEHMDIHMFQHLTPYDAHEAQGGQGGQDGPGPSAQHAMSRWSHAPQAGDDDDKSALEPGPRLGSGPGQDNGEQGAVDMWAQSGRPPMPGMPGMPGLGYGQLYRSDWPDMGRK